MPAQKGKSLMERLGNAGKEAYNQHKGDETKVSSTGDLPSGIEMGLAELIDIKFSQYKEGDLKGKDFFYAAGAVVFPTEFQGFPIRGLRTSIMEPLCDTPDRTGKNARKTVKEHMAWVLNEIRKLGLETKDIPPNEFESAVEALKDAGVTFRFRTWQSKATDQFPNPKVQHDWKGKAEPIANGEPPVSDETANGNGEEQEFGQEGDDQDIQEEETVDLDALATAAESKDRAAQDQLKNLAGEVGIDSDTIDTWPEVVEAIRAKSNGGGEVDESAAEEDAESKEFKKEEIVMYTPKGKKKAEECEIISLDKKTETLKLKSLDDEKLYANVPFDKVTMG